VPALSLPFLTHDATTQAAPKERGLVRVPRDDRGGEDVQSRSRSEFDRAAWRAKLEADDLDARERGFDALVELARRDDEARRALEEWAREGSGELAWTSRLALRSVEAARSGARGRNADPFPRRSFGADAFPDLERRMQELHERFGGMDSLFQDLQRQMEQMRIAPPARNPGGAWVWPHQGQRLELRSGSGFSMRSGPDGVKVEITEEENGETRTKTYEAESIEELLDAHPELKDRIHTGGHGSFFLDGGDADPFSTQARPLLPQASQKGLLGIHYEDVGEKEAEDLGLDSDQGLRVTSVLPGSLAVRLGIRPGDVVTEIDGRAISSAEDIKAALAERDENAEVRATVIDSKGRRRNLSYVPKAAKEREDDSERRGGGRF
jgi:hypothetical protein